MLYIFPNNLFLFFSLTSTFNFEKPSASEIFRIVLLEAEKYEESRPLKNVREDKLYTIRNHSLESITCDDNGAYGKSNGNKKAFYVSIDDTKLNAKIVHQKSGIYFYKDKEGRKYVDCEVDKKDVYEIERYYRWNKTIPQLKRTIYRIKNVSRSENEPYMCIVYFLNDYPENVQDKQILEHGNLRRNVDLKRPYIRTEPSLLKRQDELLSDNRTPQDVYEIILEE